jgi:hypothetical protein
VTTPGLGECSRGVILYDETIRQQKKDGTPFVKASPRRESYPIKVDTGAKDICGTRHGKTHWTVLWKRSQMPLSVRGAFLVRLCFSKDSIMVSSSGTRGAGSTKAVDRRWAESPSSLRGRPSTFPDALRARISRCRVAHHGSGSVWTSMPLRSGPTSTLLSKPSSSKASAARTMAPKYLLAAGSGRRRTAATGVSPSLARPTASSLHQIPVASFGPNFFRRSEDGQHMDHRDHQHRGGYFPAIRLTSGERARGSELNRGTGSSTKDASGSVTLRFLDVRGQVVKQTVAALKTGEVASLDLSRGEVPGGDSPAEIRTVLHFGYFGGAPPGPRMLERFDCNIVPSLEVYDDHAGKTRLSLTDAKSLAPPATPAK